MFRKIIVAIFLIFLTSASLISQTLSQAINIEKGFNFISFTVRPGFTAPEFKKMSAAIDDIYMYSAASGSFLSVSEGNLSSLNVGKGYIIKSNSVSALNISGAAAGIIGDITLRTGFNLLGISKAPETLSFSGFIKRLPAVKGAYKWNSASGSFIQVIKRNDGGADLPDSIDPQIISGQSFFVNVSGDTALNYDGISFAAGGGSQPPPSGGQYVVFSWNDLGMHCLNPSYDAAVILPPYNTVVAQVVRKGNPPQIVTNGIIAEYKILNNTYSYGKRNYGQFWDNSALLFGASPEKNYGLNLSEPSLSNGLSGVMRAVGRNFEAVGIPVVPVDDAGVWNPYQVAEITVKDASGSVITRTRNTVPVSDEINCAKCHGNDAFNDILTKHDKKLSTQLASQKPVLCAKCHGTPALGKNEAGVAFLSAAIHGSHASRGAGCYDCHPGANTKCNRSLKHTSPDGNCESCHGTMAQLAAQIKTGARVPWVNEPKCVTCHSGVAGVDTGSALYRNAAGHGNLRCTACHGSPHAVMPSVNAQDNYQGLQYQGKAKSIGSCGACHSRSKGEGLSEFAETHGGANPEHANACNVCHTAYTASDTAKWPHAFQWKNR